MPIKEETELVRVLYLQHCCQLVGFALTFYDHFITFDQERELIWKKRWSKSKILYLMLRYIGSLNILAETYIFMSGNPSYSLYVLFLPGTEFGLNCSCLATPIFLCVAASGVPGCFVRCLWHITVILQSRIQAFYGSRLLSRCLTAVFVAGVVGLFTLGLLTMDAMEVTSEPVPGLHRCACTKFPSYAFMFWFPILFFDTLLFLLAIGIIVISWRRRSPEAVSSGRIVPVLVAIVLRDNFGYFFLAFGMYLTTTVVWLTAEPQYFTIPAFLSYSFATIMGCRLILNLCDAYYNPPDQSYSYYYTRGTSEWDSGRPWDASTPPGIRRTDAVTPPQADTGLIRSGDNAAPSEWHTGHMANIDSKDRC
ncbi:hypothetical protein P691DRAFT_772540 [Macrolepiota fuliginosa MF-IS2]|uniref:DUF6533 domain-containing protein n=1 Tax=Macrolepiota fuliginosa MF-IS2 TaxID=1400762 RepID=A0A9P6C8J5_9AGAR|nr:hypothetical protein P691DRAFT_772540 [Macrolepiota fuliginosa MF-IS2]